MTYKRSTFFSYALFGIAMIAGGVITGHAWLANGEGGIRNIVTTILCPPFGALVMWRYLGEFRNPKGALKFDSMGVYRMYAPFDCIPWGDIDSIALVDTSTTWMSKHWNLKVVMTDVAADRQKKVALDRFIQRDYLLYPVNGLTLGPFKILSLVNTYLEDGKKRAPY